MGSDTSLFQNKWLPSFFFAIYVILLDLFWFYFIRPAPSIEDFMGDSHYFFLVIFQLPAIIPVIIARLTKNDQATSQTKKEKTMTKQAGDALDPGKLFMETMRRSSTG